MAGGLVIAGAWSLEPACTGHIGLLRFLHSPESGLILMTVGMCLVVEC